VADNRPASTRPGPQCDPALVERALGVKLPVSVPIADLLARLVVTGAPAGAVSVAPLPAGGAETVHYYCEDTGYFDGGKAYDGQNSATSVQCPPGSRVVFFTLTDDPKTPDVVEGSPEWMKSLACQSEQGICREGQPCSRPVECEK